MKLARVLATALIVGAPSTVRAQDTSVPGYRMRLLGVYDDASGDPVAGVKISDVLGGASTVTGKTGAVSLFFLPEGTSVVRLQKLGYEAQTLTVTIAPDQTTPLTLVMHHVIELPKVVTTEKATPLQSSLLSGFQEREHAHRTGYFVDDSILRKSENLSLAELLKNRTPGVNITYKQGSVYLVPSSRCRDGTKAGPPQIYLDGVALSPAGVGTSKDTPFDITGFQISDLAAVEWYPDASLVPTELARPSDRCGALFLWTRQQ